jgi:hypothetical protein
VTDYEGLLRRLIEGKVSFIVVGGLAAVAHGSARLTQDLDVVYSRSKENIARLVHAVSPLSPALRGAPPGLPFRLDEATLEHGLNFTLTTALGDLDLLGEITGGGVFEALLPHTVELRAFGLVFRCLDLECLIRVKKAAGRTRDLDAVAELELLLDEQRRGGSS